MIVAVISLWIIICNIYIILLLSYISLNFILFSINMHKYHVTGNPTGKHPYLRACVSCSVFAPSSTLI